MRDKRPFNFVKIVDVSYPLIMTVIFFQDLAVHFIHYIAGQWFSIFHFLMNCQFKFGKLGLAEKCPFKLSR